MQRTRKRLHEDADSTVDVEAPAHAVEGVCHHKLPCRCILTPLYRDCRAVLTLINTLMIYFGFCTSTTEVD